MVVCDKRLAATEQSACVIGETVFCHTGVLFDLGAEALIPEI